MIETLGTLIAIGVVLLLTAWGVRVGTRARRTFRRGGFVVVLLLGISSGPFLVPAAYLAWFLMAGQPKPVRRVLGPGVTYERKVWTHPRKIVAHITQIDLNSGCRFTVTAPVRTPNGLQNRAQVATEAIRELHADLLINASFFTPFRDNHLLDYYPHPGDVVNSLGVTISNSQRYGMPKPGWVTFWGSAAGNVGFGEPPPDAVCAVTGLRWLLHNGVAPPPTLPKAYSRTVLGVDRSHRRLWLVVVDGKQPNYSVGMTYPEVQSLLLELGASDAIELDGGGSSTMVARGKAGVPVLLSRPCHTKIPMRERPVANCLGVIFPPR